MNKIKRSVAMVVAYIMVITLLPIGALTKIVSAETDSNYDYNYNYNGNYDNATTYIDLYGCGESISKTISDPILKDEIKHIFLAGSNNDYSKLKSVSLKFDSPSAIEAFTSGTGSITVYAPFAFVNIPFSAVGKEAMKNAKSVTFNLSISENKEILDKLKNKVNKVFNFELLVEKNDGTVVSIHDFNDGVASILISLPENDRKGLDLSKYSVLYYNEETKTFEPLETLIEEELFYFETSHFSSFVIGEKDSYTNTSISTTTSSKPKTSDGYGTLGFTVAALVSLGVVAVSVYGYRKRNLEK